MVPVLLVSSLVFVYGCSGCHDEEDDFRVSSVYGGYGSEPGRFNEPMGVCVRRIPAGYRLFVSDYGNHRVQGLPLEPTLNPDSILIFAPPLLDSTDSFSPTDVTVSRRKGSEPVFIFVADGYNSKIFKFDPSGEVVGS